LYRNHQLQPLGKNMGNIYKEVFARVMLLMGNGYEKTLSLPSFNTFICPSLSLGA